MILNTKTAQDYAGQVAEANQLGFLGVRTALQSNARISIACATCSIADYEVLSRLLKQAGSLEQSGMEKSMLEMNYKLMRSWYAVSSRFSPAAAARALDEMSQVVAHFANVMGESASCAAAA